MSEARLSSTMIPFGVRLNAGRATFVVVEAIYIMGASLLAAVI